MVEKIVGIARPLLQFEQATQAFQLVLTGQKRGNSYKTEKFREQEANLDSTVLMLIGFTKGYSEDFVQYKLLLSGKINKLGIVGTCIQLWENVMKTTTLSHQQCSKE